MLRHTDLLLPALAHYELKGAKSDPALEEPWPGIAGSCDTFVISNVSLVDPLGHFPVCARATGLARVRFATLPVAPYPQMYL